MDKLRVPKLVTDAIKFELPAERVDCDYVPSNTDWAMLAAFIDGEGCIQIARCFRDKEQQMPSYKLNVSVSNTDPQLIQWCKQTFGGRAYLLPNYQPDSDRKPSYRWETNGRVATRILRECFPYSIIKQEQFRVALLFAKLSSQKRLQGYSREDLITSRETLRVLLQRLKGMIVTPDLGIIKEVKSHAA